MAGQGLKFIQSVVKTVTASGAFERVLDKVTIVSAGGGKCVAEMKVENEHQNSGGTLHGGFTATLVDCISTFALMTHGSGAPGVSVNMNISYLKAAREGEEIVIDASTLKAGKTLAFLDVEIKKKKSGEIIAKGSHTKFIGF